MCDQHEFQFDVDKAFAEQLTSALEASPKHALSDPQAPRGSGIYALYRSSQKDPVYVGQATGIGGLAARLSLGSTVSTSNPVDVSDHLLVMVGANSL